MNVASSAGVPRPCNSERKSNEAPSRIFVSFHIYHGLFQLFSVVLRIMASEKPKGTSIPIITTSLAQGLRRQHARDSDNRLQAFMDQNKRNSVNFLNLFRSDGSLAAQRRRPPSQGVPAGWDIVAFMTVPDSGEFVFSLHRCDKRRLPISKVPARVLLHISMHGTEALFQRLRTLDARAVQAELRPVGGWLLENL